MNVPFSLLQSDTWSQGFAVGMVNIAQVAGLGGALALVPGASMTLARNTGLAALTRRVVTNTGSEVVRVFSANFHRAVRLALEGGQGFAELMAEQLANFAQRLDDISLRLFNTTTGDTAAGIRQAIRNLLANDQWPPFGFEGVAEVGTGLWIEARGEFATLGQQGIRERLLNSLQMVYNSMSEDINNLLGRLTGAGATSATPDIAEQLAERIARLQSVDDASIRTALQEVGLTATDDLVAAVRGLVAPGSIIPTFGDTFGSKVKTKLNQLRKKYPEVRSANAGGIEDAQRIAQARVAQGGGRVGPPVGQGADHAIYFEDGPVTWVFRPDGSFWSMRTNPGW